MFDFPRDLRDVLNQPNTKWLPYVENNKQYFKTITKINIYGKNLVIEINKIQMLFGHTKVEHSCIGQNSMTMECEFDFQEKDGEIARMYWEDCNICKCKCCEVYCGN